MQIKPQGIVSMQSDVITMLYNHSRDTILFYTLLLAWQDEEDIKNSLNLSEESLHSIQAYLAKKNLVTLDKVVKAPKKKYMDQLNNNMSEIWNIQYCLSTEYLWIDFVQIDKKLQSRFIVYFYTQLTGKTFTSDAFELKIQKKLQQGTFPQIIEAIWRNHHNEFCNWKWNTGWTWDLAYLARTDTEKSQPLQRSLERKLDIPVSDKSIELLGKYIKAIPELSYIKSIPCKYETIRDSDIDEQQQEILRKQREIKSQLGISIEDL